jgi:signal peptidase I
MQLISLRKAKQILTRTAHHFRRKRKKLPPQVEAEIRTALLQLQQEILNKNREAASSVAKQVINLGKIHLRKTPFEQGRDFVFAIGFAFSVAILIRLVWFEFYEIPTGSMRPTLKEKDRLAVSKTDFGINTPLKPDHLYFDPTLVQRCGIFIFTGENMDIHDVDTLYFYIFPGKKQYIKRLMGKPGDILYFYGGLIYGIDAEGNPISHELQLPELSKIDHVPFIHFDGRVKTSRKVNEVYSPVVLYQMNEPVATLSYSPSGKVEARMESFANDVENYSDLWGFKNYAMARLISKEEVKNSLSMKEGVLYLELKHHPSLASARIGFDEYGRLRPLLGLSTSLIPMNEEHLKALFANLYTARFVVKDGLAFRYGSNFDYAKNFAPTLSGVPDGCYEFYYGKAYEVLFEGITKELPADHPLYTFDRERIQLLFNLGMEFDTRFAPESKHANLMPSRFAYFRKGDLYLLGAPILTKDDPTLIAFLEQEAKMSIPFVDAGPPLTADGQLDTAFIKKYGMKVPSKTYLALGDNYAMSADSREFGFVPQSNLRGGPDFIFWPPGPRWGMPNQPPYPFFNGPRTLIWILALIAASSWYAHHRRRNHLPLRDLNK